LKLIEALLNHANLAKQCLNKDDLMIDYDRNVFQVFDNQQFEDWL